MDTSIDLSDPYKIAAYIKQAKKTTVVKAFVDGCLEGIESDKIKKYGCGDFWILIGENSDVAAFLEANKALITKYDLEFNSRNSAIPLLDIRYVDARIEPGAVIRDGVRIHKNAVIMMGAIINIGAEVGENTMIDMNAVLGARASVGMNCHIGAGAVLAGVLEPPSATPVIIDDDVLIGANAVILEGIHVGKGSIVAAGSVVTRDVDPDTVVAGIPAKAIKKASEVQGDKKKLLDDLRG